MGYTPGMECKSADRSRRAASPPVLGLHIGVFLVSLSSLVFEIALTRIFSVTLWYHYAYLVVSLALFGLGAGGLLAFFGASYIKPRYPGILRQLAVFQAITMLLCLAFVLGTSLEPSLELTRTLVLVATYLAYVVCAVPFAFVGLVLALVMSRETALVSTLYFADLVGAATACLVFLGAIQVFSGPEVVLLAAGLALTASFFLAGRGKALNWRIAASLIAVIVVVYINAETRLFTVQHTKTYKEKEDIVYEKWSPIARITVHPNIFFEVNPENPFGWGMSSVFVPQKPIKQMWINQDACAGTPITAFSGDLSEVDFLRYDITYFVYHTRSATRSAFIIGPGGGRDVLAALYFGIEDIKACEINPVIVDVVKNRYRDFAGDIYSRPGVEVIVAEGRSAIRRQEQSFDVIMISLIDSWAATAAGAFALSENHLYTVEAIGDYLAKLNDDGFLSITRYLFKPRNQTLRLVVIARQALEELGIQHPAEHIAVISTRPGNGMATVLVKASPITTAERAAIEAAADRLAFVVLHLPGTTGGDPGFNRALTGPLETVIDESFYDLRPATDDWPFFFQMMYFRNAFDLILHPDDIVGQTFNYQTPLVLMGLLVIATLLVAEFYFFPLRRLTNVTGLPREWAAFFILLGVGFMFVEIAMVQKGVLYLGHPSFSLSVVLFSMMGFAGLGSLWSGRQSGARLGRTLRRNLGLAAVLALVSLAGSEALIRLTIHQTLGLKVVLFALLVGSVAFFMGTALPSGIRLLGDRQAEAIPWVWALNGGASVLGSVLAMTVAMTQGYRLTLLLGSACYVLAFLVVPKVGVPTSRIEVAPVLRPDS
ncbi:MAG: hypothetical protein V3S30_06775 [Thermoanaerobaculia bacterium]